MSISLRFALAADLIHECLDIAQKQRAQTGALIHGLFQIRSTDPHATSFHLDVGVIGRTFGTALSNGVDKLEHRLARWLLMVRDRHNSDALPLTHEFIAVMLGTRRPGVTTALHELEYKGITCDDRDAGHAVAADEADLHPALFSPPPSRGITNEDAVDF
jgi:hypothetical protein